MKKKNKEMTTYEREMQDPKFKAAFDQEYEEFALQELLLSISQGDEKSLRRLAKEAGLHPNAIQNLRSGKTNDIVNCIARRSWCGMSAEAQAGQLPNYRGLLI